MYYVIDIVTKLTAKFEIRKSSYYVLAGTLAGLSLNLFTSEENLTVFKTVILLKL